MGQETAYKVVKNLILGGHVKTFGDLFDSIYKTQLAKDAGTTPERFNKLLDNPYLFTYQDAFAIADVIGVEPKIISDLILAECQSTRKRKK